MEIFVDDDTKLTLHGLQQYYIRYEITYEIQYTLLWNTLYYFPIS